MRIIFNQEKDSVAPREKLMRISDACARLVPLCDPTTEFQGAKVSFDFRVVNDKLQIRNVILEVGPPTKLIIQ